MNKQVMAEWIKTAFLYGVIGFMAYMTFNAVYGVTGDYITAGLSIFLFDGGAYAGYKMLTGHAEGAHQRTTAKTILWIDFMLAAGMVAGNLHLIAPEIVKWIVVLAACVNGATLYYYETHDPQVMEKAVEQDEADAQTEAARRNRRMLHKTAMRRAEQNIIHQARPLGDLMALRAQAQLKYEMRLPMTPEEQTVWEADVIEADAIPALPDPDPIKGGVSFWDFLARIFGGKQPTPQPATPSTEDEQTPEPQPPTPSQP